MPHMPPRGGVMSDLYDRSGVCYGTHREPADGSVVGRNLSGPGKYPGKGNCPVCGREYKLLWDGLIRKHGVTR